LSVTSLTSILYLCIHLMATAHSKGWWSLHKRLIERRGWYARRHRTLMNYPFEVLDKKPLDIREELNDLEKEFNKEENRFGEVRETIGSVQGEGIYPSIVGFKRPLLSALLKIIIPLPFAAILVWVETNWLTLVLLLVLILAYFLVKFYWLRAITPTREWLNASVFILAGYISIFLFILENHDDRNYFGWYYIVLLTVYAGASGLG
jgi:hypothetical protein